MERISLREFARRLGVNVNAVQQALANGRIVRGDDKKIEWESQSKAWETNRDESKARDATATGGKEQSEFQKYKTQKEKAIAGRKEIELQVMRGELVPSAHVRRAIAQYVIDIRDGVMMLGDRFAAELAAAIAGRAPLDQEEVKVEVLLLWRREARLIMEKIASDPGERIGGEQLPGG